MNTQTKSKLGNIVSICKFLITLSFVFFTVQGYTQKEVYVHILTPETHNVDQGEMVFYYDDWPTTGNSHRGYRYMINSTPDWLSETDKLLTVKKVKFDRSFAEAINDGAITNIANWFNGCTALENIEGIDNILLQLEFSYNNKDKKIEATNVSGLFKGCENLSDYHILKFLDLLDISQVTDFSEMFAGCKKIENIAFNEKYVNPSSSTGRNFEKMFQNCENIKTINIRPITIADNDQKSQMFSGCSALSTIYVSSLTTDNIDKNSDMFTGCENLRGDIKDAFTLVKEAYGILDNQGTLTLYYDTQRDTRKQSAYKDYDIYKTTNTYPGWYDALYSENPNADCFKIIEVYTDDTFKDYNSEDYSCVRWFAGLTNATKIDISNLNMTNVEYITNMFENCKKLTNIIFPKPFITDKITLMNGVFAGCECLQWEIITPIITTKNLEYYYDLFYGCASLTEIDLSNFKFDNVTDMSRMFGDCEKLTKITFPDYMNTNKVEDFSQLFQNCKNLETLDLRKIDIRNATDLQSMFDSCTNLKTILVDPEKWNTEKATYYNYVFRGCENLVGENGTKYNENHIDREYARVDSDGAPGYLTDGKYTISYIHKDQNGKTINITLDNNYPTEYTYDDNDITINKPTQMPGYSFKEWKYTISTDKTNKDGGEQINIPQNSVGNYEITIKWNIESYSVKLPENMEFVTPSTEDNKFAYDSTVTFKAKDGYKVTEGPEITFPEIEVSIQQDNDLFSFKMPSASDGVIIEATVVEKPKFTVSFVTEYGTAPAQQIVIEDGKVQIPDVTLQQPAYEFKGWKTSDGELYNFDTPVTSSFTLTADWQKAPLKITPSLSDADKYISFPKDWKQFCKKQETYAELSYSITGGGEPDSCYITIESIEGTHQYHANNGKVEITTLPSFPGEYACTAVFTGDEESTTPSDTIKFTLEITAARGLILQLYKNVIFVNNISEKFETYQWYRYGEETDEKLKNGERQYFTEPTLKGSYWALLNGKIHACYMEDQPVIVKQAEVSISTYPNPAVEGEQFTIEINNFDPDTEYSLIISNSNGNIIKQLTVTKQQTTLSLPRGFYTGALMWLGNKQSFKIIVR